MSMFQPRAVKVAKSLKHNLGEAQRLIRELLALMVKIESEKNEIYDYMSDAAITPLNDLTKRFEEHKASHRLSPRDAFLDKVVEDVADSMKWSQVELSEDIRFMERFGKYSKLLRDHATLNAYRGFSSAEELWASVHEDWDIPAEIPKKPQFD